VISDEFRASESIVEKRADEPSLFTLIIAYNLYRMSIVGQKNREKGVI